MHISEAAYRLHLLFDQKIMSEYYNSFKGEVGRVQLEALNYLVEHSGVRGQKLSEALNVPKQHISKMMDRLENMELICRAPDPQDSRAVLYSLSPAGRDMMRRHIEQSNRLFESRLAALNAEDQEKLAASMMDMMEILKKL